MKPLLPFALAAVAVLGSSLAIAEDEPLAPSLLAAAPADSSAPPSSPEAAPPAPPAPPTQRSWGQRHGRDGQPGAGGNQFFRERREHFQRPGGERPDGAPQSEGQGRGPRPQAPAPKPAPYIGVAISAVPPILASQLGLAENFGLVVDNVLPNSPAASAGLQKYDVLKLYNDQQIIDPRQLVILVHATGKNGNATLTVIRKGQEQKVSITIAEGVMPNLLAAHHPGPGMREDGFGRQGFDRQRLSRDGIDHRGFGEGWRRHEGFGRHPFDGDGFGPGRSGQQGFGRPEFWHHHFAGRGFGGDGFDCQGRWGRHFGGREFDGRVSEGRGFARQEFEHQDSAGRGFERDGSGDRPFGHRSFEHGGPQHQPPGDGEREQQFQGRPGGWFHHPSSDLEPSPEPPAVDLEQPPLRDASSADTASVETESDQSLPAETQAAEEEPAPAPVFEGEPLDPVVADANVL